MTHLPLQPEVPLQIKTPCPMKWDDLAGDGPKRFCSQCSLHVHDGAQLTRDEARELVTSATERVCMRLQFDPSGAPMFRGEVAAERTVERPRLSAASRIARWTLTTAAGLLAACHRGASNATVVDPTANPSPPDITRTMGEVCVPEKLGDVQVPTVKTPEIMGKVAVSTPPNQLPTQPPPPTPPK